MGFPPRGDRHEWFVILAFTLLGAGVRLAWFGSIGLAHFDEGIYATSGLWSIAPGGLLAFDPGVIPYAPPVFPILVGVSYGVLGVADTPAILVSALAGILTVPVAGWLGRHCFGRGAGAAAAAFAALSMAHIAFSRRALTDAPFLLAWLLAIGSGIRYLERPSWARAIVLGLSVGLAQGVKYNGALSGVIVALGAILGLAVGKEDRRFARVVPTFGLGLVAATTGALAYAPWIAFVQRHGGYARLLAHHRSYAGGLEAWPRHWDQQLAQVVALSGGPIWGALAWGLAWAGSGVSAGRLRLGKRFDPGVWTGAIASAVGGAVVLGVVPTVAWWVGLFLLPGLLRDPRPSSRVVGVWWAGLSVITPFYHPYARLWLPLHAVGWLLLGGAITRLSATTGESVRDGPLSWRVTLGGDSWRAVAPIAAVAVIALAALHHTLASATPFPLRDFVEPTSELRRACARAVVLSTGPGPPRPPIMVLARRPAAFYLATLGRSPFVLLEGPGPLLDRVPRRSLALVDDSQVDWESLVKASRGVEGWVELDRVVGRLDPVTRLDVAPDSARGRPDRNRCALRILERRN